VHADEKGPYILHSEVEKAIKVTRDKKAVRDDNIYMGMYSEYWEKMVSE
jgi:hypothetical protein